MSLFEDLQRVLDLNRDNKFEELASAKKSLIKKISSIGNPNCRVEYPCVLTILKEFIKDYDPKPSDVEYLLDGFQIYLTKKIRYGGEKTYYINMIIANELIKIEAKKTHVEDHSGSTEYEFELIWNGKRTHSWRMDEDISEWGLNNHIVEFLIWADEDSHLTCALLDEDYCEFNYSDTCLHEENTIEHSLIDEFDETINFI